MTPKILIADMKKEELACGDFSGVASLCIDGDIGGNAQANTIRIKDGLLQFEMPRTELHFFGAWELEVFLKAMRQFADELYPRPEGK